MNANLESNAIAQAIASWLERHGWLESVRNRLQKIAATANRLKFQFLLRLRPGNVRIRYQVVRSLLLQARWSQAIAICDQILQVDSTFAPAHQALGEAYMGQGDWPGAIRALEAAIVLDPSVCWFHNDLGKAHLSRGNWPAAIAAFRAAVAAAPQEFWTLYGLGEALVKGGQWSEASVTLTTAISMQPAFPWAHYYLGDALLALEQVEAAVAAYEQAVCLRPHNHYIRESLTYARHLQKQDRKLADYCRQQPDDSRQLQILMLMPYAPYPPKSGAIARMFYELKTLGAIHSVVLVALAFSKAEIAYETELEKYCDLAVLVALGDAPPRKPEEPKSVNRYSSQRFRSVLQQLQSARFDIVSHNFVYTAQYEEFFPEAFHILAEHNIESELLRRSACIQQDAKNLHRLAEQTDAVKDFWEAEREAQLLATYEDEIWAKFPLRTTVSDLDKQILDDRCSFGQTLVVNNGIDTASVDLLPRHCQLSYKRLLFIGTMSYYPNIDAVLYFTEEILPHIWERDPEICFWVAGASPPQTVTDLSKEPRIRVIANPEDMSAVARDCSISIAPIRFGSGTRIKILHAMAMGLPVVSTGLGCEGLQVNSEEHLLVGDSPVEFATATVRLATDSDLQEKLRANGRKLVERLYDWNGIYTQAAKEYVQAFQAWQQAPDRR